MVQTSFHRPLFSFFLALACFTGPIYAQVPTEVAHQGSLTVDGSPVTDASASITFALYTAVTGGTALWTETQTGVSVVGGLFTVQLGSVSSLASVAFDVPYWLGTTYGGTPLTPRYQLASLPYARGATSAEAAPWSGLYGTLPGFDYNADLLEETGTECNPWVIPYMPYGTGTSQLIYFINTSDVDTDVYASALDDQGTAFDLGNVGTASAHDMLKLQTLLATALTTAGFDGSGKIAFGLTAGKISSLVGGIRVYHKYYVHASYTLTSNSSRTEVDVLCIK